MSTATMTSPKIIIPKEIIKNSIRSAICIDDQFAAPYESGDHSYNIDTPSRLYYSFRQEGNCDLDIFRYTNIQEWKENEHLIHNKDLMILDWELDSSADKKYSSTLSILDSLLPSKLIPFVVIYTSSPDLNTVAECLLSHYSNFSTEDYSKILDLLEEKFKRFEIDKDDIESFLEAQKQIFTESIIHFSKRDVLENEFVSEFSKHFSKNPEPELITKNFSRTLKKLTNNNNWLLNLAYCFFAKSKSTNSFPIHRVEISPICLNINGIIILLVHKEPNSDGVSPDHLFNTFSDAISNNPHNIVNLVSLELKDKLREHFAVIGTNFNSVNEDAFLTHAYNYTSKGNSFQKDLFKDFVVRSWIHELLQQKLDMELLSFDLIEPKPAKDDAPDLYEELAKYAATISTVRSANRSVFNLNFGDIYKTTDGKDYFLCITPLCDCLRPNKINNQFHFVKSSKNDTSKLKIGLEKAETNYLSFINEYDTPIVIEWEPSPFTSYVEPEHLDSKVKLISYANRALCVEYVCSLKENYTQRIANRSFGHSQRVGINLPNLKESSEKNA